MNRNTRESDVNNNGFHLKNIKILSKYMIKKKDL
jgi:hypothetical protein